MKIFSEKAEIGKWCTYIINKCWQHKATENIFSTAGIDIQILFFNFFCLWQHQITYSTTLLPQALCFFKKNKESVSKALCIITSIMFFKFYQFFEIFQKLPGFLTPLRLKSMHIRTMSHTFSNPFDELTDIFNAKIVNNSFSCNS